MHELLDCSLLLSSVNWALWAAQRIYKKLRFFIALLAFHQVEEAIHLMHRSQKCISSIITLCTISFAAVNLLNWEVRLVFPGGLAWVWRICLWWQVVCLLIIIWLTWTERVRAPAIHTLFSLYLGVKFFNLYVLVLRIYIWGTARNQTSIASTGSLPAGEASSSVRRPFIITIFIYNSNV